jgi:uridine kinase
MDIFFKNKTFCHFNGFECWEHTDCIWFSRLIDAVKALKNGKGITIRDRSLWTGSYDTEIFQRDFHDKKVVIVEGFLLFTNKKLSQLFDTRLFIDISDNNILSRRIAREGEKSKRYIEDVIIPVSKEYDEQQKNNSEKIFDGNMPLEEVMAEVGKYLIAKLQRQACDMKILFSLDQPTYKVQAYDLISDHKWHPIDYANLKDWVKRNSCKNRLASGEELRGNTFRYRKNLDSGYCEISLTDRKLLARYDSNIET